VLQSHGERAAPGRAHPALVQASLPILRLREQGTTGSSMITALDAINLTNQAKLAAAGNLMELSASSLTVNSGAAVSVNNGPSAATCSSSTTPARSGSATARR